MTAEVRIADRRDYRAFIRLRAGWLDRFIAAHPAEERWCPAGSRVPNVEDEYVLFDHLPRPDRADAETLVRKNDCWGVVASREGQPVGYLLWRAKNEKQELEILAHTPRVSARSELEQAGGPLIELVLEHAGEQGLKQVSISLHGFPDDVDPLVNLYRAHGFEGEPRWEMVTHRLRIDPGPHQLQFRAAGEVGLETFSQSEVISGQCSSAEESQKDCESSQRMWWSVEPDTDWLIAYEGGEVVGTVRVAVTASRVGLVDGIAVAKERRGRGLGRVLLAHALSALIGRTDVVWLDTDHDNVRAQQLYKWAGFQLHHRHGVLVAKLPQAETKATECALQVG